METAVQNTTAAAPTSANARLGRRLLAALKQELILQNRLLAVATQTREAIIERRVDALELLQQAHHVLLAEMERAAAERMDISQEIARAAHIPVESLTLSQVADACPGAIALQISVVRALLLEIATQVQSAQLLNRELLENEMGFIGSSLEVLARAAAPRRSYRAPLDVANVAGAPAILMNKAA